MTEVLLVTAPADQLPAASKQQILLQLLQTLLNKVGGEEDTAPGLAHLLSSAVLLLLTALRQTYDAVPDRAAVMSDTFVGLLDTTAAAVTTQQQQGGAFSASLHVILKGLIGWILSKGAGNQVIRTNIYSALLAYLRIGKTTAALASPHSSHQLELSEAGKLQKANLDIILGQGGPALLEIVARDASSGHEVRRMLALALLDELVVLDRLGACTRFLTDQGFLRHLIDSLLVDEAALVDLLTQQPGGNIRDLCVFEAKLGLLARVAARPQGAELLLQAGLMARLAEFSVLDLRPEPDAAFLLQKATTTEDGDETAGSAALSRYHSILFPVLRLCESVLASLGSENRSAAAQSLHFLTGHEEVVALILRGSTARASLAPALLQELALLTAVVSRAATLDLRSEAAAMDATSFELSGQLARIQRQMLSLLQLFQLNESLVATLEEDADRSGAGLSRSLLVMQIVANVVSYSRAVVSAGGSSARSCRLVVSPALLEVAEGGGSQATGRPASLGLLVMTTRHLAAQLAKTQVCPPSFPTLACLKGAQA